MQDNLEFLQWSKRYWDQHFPGGEYDAVARRKGTGMPASVGAPRGISSGSSSRRGGIAPGAASRTRTPIGGSGGGGSALLQQQLAEAKEESLALEKERDFYFSKLRDIELLVQNEVTAHPELEQEEGFLKQVQTVLYSTEEGFEIPLEDGAEPAEDLETF
jgi:RP/EB family microtubule-associated protein